MSRRRKQRWLGGCKRPHDELEAAVGQPDVAVSCVGTVGFDGRGLELGNGVANVRAAEALKGVQRFAVHESNFAGLGVDTCSTAWRCQFLAARRSQHGHSTQLTG